MEMLFQRQHDTRPVTFVFLEVLKQMFLILALEAGIQSLDLKTKTNADGTPNWLGNETLEKLRNSDSAYPEGKRSEFHAIDQAFLRHDGD